jgi:dipeptidase E
MVGLGWKSLGVLELTALPSLADERWVPLVRETDVLLVDGGDAAYLCHWLRASGLADLLPSLRDTVWVGVSAGSMVMTPRVGADFVTWDSQAGDKTLGVVEFSIFPHLDNPDFLRTRWPRQRSGPVTCRPRRTRSTTRPRSEWSTAPST